MLPGFFCMCLCVCVVFILVLVLAWLKLTQEGKAGTMNLNEMLNYGRVLEP